MLTTKADCDDADKNTKPGVDESKEPYACDGKDNNCDGVIDGVKVAEEFCNLCVDFDKDGYQNPAAPKGCTLTTQPDCLDTDSSAYPGSKWQEGCDGIDQDCNGITDGFKENQDNCPKCIDSDGGVNPQVGGTTLSWYDAWSKIYTGTDHCFLPPGGKILILSEEFCGKIPSFGKDGGVARNEFIDCGANNRNVKCVDPDGNGPKPAFCR